MIPRQRGIAEARQKPGAAESWDVLSSTWCPRRREETFNVAPQKPVLRRTSNLRFGFVEQVHGRVDKVSACVGKRAFNERHMMPLAILQGVPARRH
jgi:hypothetical protein